MNDHALPLPDYDQLPLGSLQHRIRSLDADELRVLVDHERGHGNRTPVLEVLSARLDQLAEGATPSAGEHRRTPEVTSTPGGSPVSPATSPDDNTPLRHGVEEQTPSRGRP